MASTELTLNITRLFWRRRNPRFPDPVPEPTTLALVGLGGLGMAMLARDKKRASKL